MVSKLLATAELARAEMRMKCMATECLDNDGSKKRKKKRRGKDGIIAIGTSDGRSKGKISTQRKGAKRQGHIRGEMTEQQELPSAPSSLCRNTLNFSRANATVGMG